MFSTCNAEIYALIIGISDYQYENNLKYADDDAQAFETFLIHGLDQRIKSENIVKLLNEKATGAGIINGFKWLVSNSKPEDLVIIYFAGHGAYEDLTFKRFGFLLGHDGHNESYTAGGNIPLDYLNAFLETLDQQNIKTIFISDACHSGKINDNSGEYIFINERLAGELNSVTKILSSQGTEFSFEDNKWGGGHGIFTYSLIKGLIGFADNSPKDEYVNIREIGSFLDETVPKSTDYRQNPMVISRNRNQNIVKVNSAAYSIFENIFNKTPADQINLQDELTRGFSNSKIQTIQETNISHQQLDLVDQFNRALDSANLIGNKNSAYYYFTLLADQNMPSIAIENYRMLLSNALLDKAQNIVNQYLSGNIFHYQEYRDASTAIDLALKVDNQSNSISLNNKKIQAQKFFLDVYDWYTFSHQNDAQFRDPIWIRNNSNLFLSKIEMLDSAISLDQNAAYLYNAKGAIYLYMDSFDRSKALASIRVARKLAPNWTLPVSNLAYLAGIENKPEETILRYYDTLFSLNNNHLLGHYNLASYYRKRGNVEKSINALNKAELIIENYPPKNNIQFLVFRLFGLLYMESENFEASLTYFRKAEAIQPENIEIKENISQIKEAIDTNKK